MTHLLLHLQTDKEVDGDKDLDDTQWHMVRWDDGRVARDREGPAQIPRKRRDRHSSTAGCRTVMLSDCWFCEIDYSLGRTRRGARARRLDVHDWGV